MNEQSKMKRIANNPILTIMLIVAIIGFASVALTSLIIYMTPPRISQENSVEETFDFYVDIRFNLTIEPNNYSVSYSIYHLILETRLASNYDEVRTAWIDNQTAKWKLWTFSASCASSWFELEVKTTPLSDVYFYTNHHYATTILGKSEIHLGLESFSFGNPSDHRIFLECCLHGICKETVTITEFVPDGES